MVPASARHAGSGRIGPSSSRVAPLPKNYAIDETVYSAAGQARDASIGSNGSDAIIVEVKVNSSIAPGTTARFPQFSSARTVLLKKGVTGNVLTGSGQAVCAGPIRRRAFRSISTRCRLSPWPDLGCPHRWSSPLRSTSSPIYWVRRPEQAPRLRCLALVFMGLMLGLAPALADPPSGAAPMSPGSGTATMRESAAATTSTTAVLTLGQWEATYEHDIGILADDVLVVVDDGKRAQVHLTKAKVRTTLNDCRQWVRDAGLARDGSTSDPDGRCATGMDEHDRCLCSGGGRLCRLAAEGDRAPAQTTFRSGFGSWRTTKLCWTATSTARYPALTRWAPYPQSPRSPRPSGSTDPRSRPCLLRTESSVSHSG